MSLSFSSFDWAKLPEMPALPAHLQAWMILSDYKQGWEWSRTISAEMVGVQGRLGPGGVQGQGPGRGCKGGDAHFEAKTWPLLERKVLNYQRTE